MSKVNKKRILLASTLAVLIAPTVLNNIGDQSTIAQADPITINGDTLNNPIGTVDYGGIDAVDSNGNKTGLFLPGKSSWKLGSAIQINGQTYYGIGVNQYVSLQDIVVSDNVPPVENTLVKETGNQIGTLNQAATVIDMSGNANGIVLPTGSSWKLGNLYSINGSNYYQVATNEYIAESTVNTSNSAGSPVVATPENTDIALPTDTQIFDDNGNATGKYLPKGSFWHSDFSKSMNNSRYYRIATNEWVTLGGSSTSNVFDNGPVTLTLSKNTQLYNSSSNTYTRTLPAGSAWRTFSAVKNKNNQIFVKVSTDEWLPLNGTNLADGSITFADIVYAANYDAEFAVNYDQDKTITANLIKDQKVYDTSSNSMTRTLPSGSSWKISQVVRNNQNQFWGKVSNNEWLLIDANTMSMNYGDSDSVPSMATSEPSFATNIAQ